MSQFETETKQDRSTEPELGETLHRVLADPLSALRASMESLLTEVGHDAPHGTRLEGVLDQVTRLARDVQSLVELTGPHELAPLSCSLDELARSAQRALPSHLRERVRFARPSLAQRVWVDGPTVSRSLTHLLQAALSGGCQDVLLCASQGAEHTAFTLVHESEAGHWMSSPEQASREVHLAVARRDVARMGGSLEVRCSEQGTTCTRIELSNPHPSGRLERAA